MRALVIEPGPDFSVKDVHAGIVSGLQANGVHVVPFNLADRLNFYCNVELCIDGEYRRALEYEAACQMAAQGIRAEAFGYRPDVVIVVSSFFIPPDTFTLLRLNGIKVVLWCTESPYEDPRQIRMAAYADVVILNDPTNLDEFRKQNPRTYYLPHAYQPAVHHAEGRVDTIPFSFVGTGYQSRIDFFEKVNWPADPELYGNWQQVTDDSPLLPFLMHERGQCVDNDDAAKIYRQSATSANLYRKEAMDADCVDGWAMGPREVELAACGTWFAREPRGESDELFPMLPTFTEPAELGDLIRWALSNPDLRVKAAAQARAAIADRTFERNAARFLSLLGA